MRGGVCVLAGIAGLVAIAVTPRPGSAQDLNQFVRTLNAVLNPQDAQRLEERARREGRADEERYWRDYRAGLEHRPPAQEERRYGEAERRYHQVGPEEARGLEEQARRERRYDEARYWRDYRAGLDDRASSDRPGYAIRAEEARRFEERSRRAHRIEEEHYWRDYRAGLEGRPRE